MAKRTDRFVVIGAGRVGTAVGHILQESGEKVLAVASRSDESLEQAKEFIESALFTADVVKAGKGKRGHHRHSRRPYRRYLPESGQRRGG